MNVQIKSKVATPVGTQSPEKVLDAVTFPKRLRHLLDLAIGGEPRLGA